MSVPLTGPERRRVEALRRWATLLDAAFGIPGTRFRVGLDALIGLVPGVGDAVSGVFSAALIVQAARMGIPRVVLGRMAANVLIDVLVGAIPFLGDLFDVGWKANLRNVALLERFVLGGARTASAPDYLFLGGVVAAIVVATFVPVLLLLLLLQALGRPLL